MIATVRTAAALAVTVGIAYVACTVVFWGWPDAAAHFMSWLFHGLDFRKLQDGASGFRFGGFFYALVVLMAWAFAAGILFAWVRGRLVR